MMIDDREAFIEIPADLIYLSFPNKEDRLKFRPIAEMEMDEYTTDIDLMVMCVKYVSMEYMQIYIDNQLDGNEDHDLADEWIEQVEDNWFTEELISFNDFISER